MWEHKNQPSMPRHFRRERPSWWPENEAWPPTRPPWRGYQARFFRRMGCLLALANTFFILVIGLVVGLVANGLGYVHVPRTLWWIVPAGVLLSFFGIGILILTGRSLHRMSAPLGNLVDAAERISVGDYSTQVPEKGNREIRSLTRAFNSMAERLKVSEEQRRDLMADITHELRTPLTVMQGNLEAMIDGVYPRDEAQLKSLFEETQILSRLVEDLRTLALAESGALQLKKEPTDLALLAGETVSAFRTQADASGITLTVNAAEELPPCLVDPERIRQVLANLLANALRYTPRGGTIRIDLQMEGNEEKRTAVIRVQDNGVGIAPDILPQIFNRFYKSRDSSGTGLGLPIARHLVEAHGGAILAESQAGQGTTITVSLPVLEG